MLWDGAFALYWAMVMHGVGAAVENGFGTTTTAGTSASASPEQAQVQVVFIDGQGPMPFDDRLATITQLAPVYHDEAGHALCPFGHWCRFQVQ